MSEKEQSSESQSQSKASETNDAGNQLLQTAWASQVDAQTTQQFTGLAAVRQARVNQLQREAALLIRLYGANDSRVQAVQANLANQQAFAVKLGVARDASATAAPTAPAGGWVLYGHVRHADLTPAAQYTVFLADKGRSWLTPYGYAFTDQNGYYELSYAPAPVTPSGTKAGQKHAAAAAPLSAFVEVSDAACHLVFVDTTTTAFPVGAAINKDIVLASDNPLGTPPCQEGAPPATPPAQKPAPK